MWRGFALFLVAEGVSRESISPISVFRYAEYLSDKAKTGSLKDSVICCYDRLIALGIIRDSDVHISQRLQKSAARPSSTSLKSSGQPRW